MSKRGSRRNWPEGEVRAHTYRMNGEEVRTLIAYSQWANRALLGATRALTADEFSRDLRTSHGSVRGTLVHIIGGEWKWLELWKGQTSKQINDAFLDHWYSERFRDATALESEYHVLSNDQSEFVQALTDTALGARLSFENSRGSQHLSMAQSIQHVVNHSSYHRGQVVTLLRQLGRPVVATDFHAFLLNPTR